ncbi:flavin reductase family protein [Nguyenibacter vanlangensis]|uniref:Flavin reductase family protein n=2 Tax=Nguyenibacter vanlangensis TaxID=1216886 RepID=A0A7Y7IT52_9PROT|nr:flavin reductase family protein [Nguyenibacter vanlangensis]
MIFDFTQLDAPLRYKLLGSTITPRPIAWVSSLDETEVANAAPFSFFNAFGEDPPVVGFSILSRSMHDRKDTGNNVRARGEFVVNLVSEETLEQMNVTAIDFGPGVSEFAEAGLTASPSIKIRTPRIAESRVALECKVMQIVELGPMRSLVLGEVLAMHIADDAVLNAERGYIDTPSLRIIGRAGPNSYVQTTQVIKLPSMSVGDWDARQKTEA